MLRLMAGGLFEDAHPQLSLAGVVHPQPGMELLRRLKRLVRFIAHVLIAACEYFTRATGTFGIKAAANICPTRFARYPPEAHPCVV